MGREPLTAVCTEIFGEMLRGIYEDVVDSKVGPPASCPRRNDRDGDGVPDREDICPDSWCGVPVDESGCMDSDDDEAGNDVDLCDRDSTGGRCETGSIEDCFTDADDNVCAGIGGTNCEEVYDMDGDGIGNKCDEDTDGDGLNNGSDPDPFDADADNDGLCDGDPANPVRGVCETGPDPCPLDAHLEPNASGRCEPEADDVGGEEIDTEHGCPKPVPTPAEEDPDHDGVTAEPVVDPVTEEGLEGEADNCPAVPNKDQADEDGDGIGDACDGSSSESTADHPVVEEVLSGGCSLIR